jgi:hypothetical protein
VITTLDKYIPFEKVSDDDVIKAQLFNECRLGESGCWLWMGTKRNGYGLFNIGSKSKSAHRVAYELFIGPIPTGLHLLHSCDTPSCINPAHLRPGTVKENMADRESRRRRCVRGEQIGTSKLTYDDVVSVRTSPLSISVLAKAYKVDYQTIWKIRKGISWKHVEDQTKVDGTEK